MAKDKPDPSEAAGAGVKPQAGPGADAAKGAPKVPISSDYKWAKPGQTQFSHSVDTAVTLIEKAPRPIEIRNLERAVIAEYKGKPYVRWGTVVECFYHANNLPPDTNDVFPIIIGIIKGREFILDGKHRLARAVLSKKKTIPVVRLTEAESKACIRPGLEKRVEEMNLNFPD